MPANGNEPRPAKKKSAKGDGPEPGDGVGLKQAAVQTWTVTLVQGAVLVLALVYLGCLIYLLWARQIGNLALAELQLTYILLVIFGGLLLYYFTELAANRLEFKARGMKITLVGGYAAAIAIIFFVTRFITINQTFRYVDIKYNADDLKFAYDTYNPADLAPGYFVIRARGPEGKVYTIRPPDEDDETCACIVYFGPEDKEVRLSVVYVRLSGTTNPQVRGLKKIFEDRVVYRQGDNALTLGKPVREDFIRIRGGTDAGSSDETGATQ